MAVGSETRAIGALLIAVAVTGLLAVQSARAEPMKCSAENKACIATCKKGPNRLSACLTDCGARQSFCMRTGCWDNGVQRYCGLAKQ